MIWSERIRSPPKMGLHGIMLWHQAQRWRRPQVARAEHSCRFHRESRTWGGCKRPSPFHGSAPNRALLLLFVFLRRVCCGVGFVCGVVLRFVCGLVVFVV